MGHKPVFEYNPSTDSHKFVGYEDDTSENVKQAIREAQERERKEKIDWARVSHQARIEQLEDYYLEDYFLEEKREQFERELEQANREEVEKREAELWSYKRQQEKKALERKREQRERELEEALKRQEAIRKAQQRYSELSPLRKFFSRKLNLYGAIIPFGIKVDKLTTEQIDKLYGGRKK